jgi:heme-degrading monooxygenase HmoA
MAVVKINAIEVPDGAGAELEKRFAARADSVKDAPGFLEFNLLRPVAGDNRYFVYTRWESEEAFQAWAQGRGQHGGEGRPKPVSTGASLLEFEVVQHIKSVTGGLGNASEVTTPTEPDPGAGLAGPAKPDRGTGDGGRDE